VTAAPLVPEPDRQAILGGRMLADVESDLLGDDPYLREQLTELAGDLRRWDTAAAQAVCVHLRLADEPHEGYTPADLTTALADYRFARGLVLARIADIVRHTHMEEPQ